VRSEIGEAAERRTLATAVPATLRWLQQNSSPGLSFRAKSTLETGFPHF
jgi:hypothetical protein